MADTDQIFNLLRWGLTFAGSYLVSRGVTTDAQWTAVSGGLMAAVSMGWGIFAHTVRQRILSVASDTSVASVRMNDPAVGAGIPSNKVT